MGVSLCKNGDTHISVSYDIQTVPQGIIFLCYGIFCACCEVLFMFFTIRFFCASGKSLSRVYFLLFYLSFHLSLLSSVLYFTGGIVCYGIVLYNAISNFSYLFQGIGVYAVTMQMFDSLLVLSQVDGHPIKCKPLWCLPIILAYLIGFLAIFFTEILNGVLHYFYIYNAACHLILAGSFFVVSKTLYGEMSMKYPSLVSQENKSTWVGVAYTIMILMIVRAALAIFNVMGLTFYLKSHHLGLFTLYIIVFITIFDLLPCITLAFFMQIHIDNSIERKSLGRLKNETSSNEKRFTITTESNLMEEMVDYENAEEDWA